MVSFNTVEQSAFKFTQQYLVQSKHFSNADDVEYVALTTDMWSGCNMMLLRHYVIKEYTLGSSFVPESQQPEALLEIIHDC